MSAIASLNATFLVTKVTKATRSSKSVKCVFSAEKLGKVRTANRYLDYRRTRAVTR
jgi:hypothetical protein